MTQILKTPDQLMRDIHCPQLKGLSRDFIYAADVLCRTIDRVLNSRQFPTTKTSDEKLATLIDLLADELFSPLFSILAIRTSLIATRKSANDFTCATDLIVKVEDKITGRLKRLGALTGNDQAEIDREFEVLCDAATIRPADPLTGKPVTALLRVQIARSRQPDSVAP